MQILQFKFSTTEFYLNVSILFLPRILASKDNIITSILYARVHLYNS